MKMLHYTAAGDGSPVILLHGLAASSRDWNTLLPTLAHTGYAAYAPDLPGHGDSPKPIEPAWYHSDEVFSTLDHWLDGLHLDHPITLIGHSLGGHYSLRLSLKRPQQVRALILVDPFYSSKQLYPIARAILRKPEWGDHIIRRIPPWVIQNMLGWDPTHLGDFTPAIRRQIAIDYLRASPLILRIPATLPELTHELPHLKQPTLVIWGKQDLTLHPSSFPHLVSLLPKATGYPIPRCGHQPHIGKPTLVNNLIISFLCEITSG